MGYREDLNEARVALGEMMREKEEQEVRIAKQKRKVAALAELCDESEFSDETLDLGLGSISDAVRTAMRSSRKEWLNAGEIKSRLEELGFPVNDYKAPVATITTVLKRMAEGNEVVIEKRGVYSEYKWVGSIQQINALLKSADKKQHQG